ncbi:hypothetical protein PS3A_40860 [Pseudomonas sp. 3A(2025)]
MELGVADDWASQAEIKNKLSLLAKRDVKQWPPKAVDVPGLTKTELKRRRNALSKNIRSEMFSNTLASSEAPSIARYKGIINAANAVRGLHELEALDVIDSGRISAEFVEGRKDIAMIDQVFIDYHKLFFERYGAVGLDFIGADFKLS